MAAQKKFEFVSVCRSSVDETLLEKILSFFFMWCATSRKNVYALAVY